MKHNPVLANQLKSKWEHHRRMAEIYEAAWRAEVSEIAGSTEKRKKESPPLAESKTRVTPNPKTSSDEIKFSNPGREWLRELFREHKEGLTPAQIREFAQVDSFDFNDSFPYTSLWKLKSKGELTEKGGKYFLVSNENASVQ